MIDEYFEKHRKETIYIAEDLMYSKNTIRKLQRAKTEIEISNIMKQARLNDEGADKSQ